MSRPARVQVTLDLSAHFVRMLKANVGLSGGLRPGRDLDPAGVLARAVLLEAQGAPPDQFEETIPPDWAGDVAVDHAQRRYLLEGEREWRHTKTPLGA